MTAKILQFPGPRRHGRTACLLEYARDFMRHNPDKKVVIVTLDKTEVWRDGALIETVPHGSPVSDQNRCDAVIADKVLGPMCDPETIQFPPHKPRASLPEWSGWWPTPPKDEK